MSVIFEIIVIDSQDIIKSNIDGTEWQHEERNILLKIFLHRSNQILMDRDVLIIHVFLISQKGTVQDNYFLIHIQHVKLIFKGKTVHYLVIVTEFQIKLFHVPNIEKQDKILAILHSYHVNESLFVLHQRAHEFYLQRFFEESELANKITLVIVNIPKSDNSVFIKSYQTPFTILLENIEWRSNKSELDQFQDFLKTIRLEYGFCY